MKPFLLCLLAALILQGAPTAARACQYCRMAADDPEMARLAAEMHAKTGGFPLDSAVNKFQAITPSAVLTAPPPTASVTTSAADLPKATLPAATTHRLPPAAPLPVSTAKAATPASSADRWANGGLLGLLGLMGFFGWRTRKSGGSAS